MINDNFGNLEKIVTGTIQNAIKIKELKLPLLFQQMESEFARLGFRESSKGGVKNILLVRLDNVGDFLLTIPAIREIRMNYPSAFITLVVREKVYSVAELCPYVNEVLIFEEKLYTNNLMQMFLNVTAFAKKFLWRRRYDIGFSFRYWEDVWHLISLIMLYLGGVVQRVGYVNKAIQIYRGKTLTKENDWSYDLLTHPVINPKEIVHDCARSLYIPKSFGLTIRNTNMEFWYDKTDLNTARRLLGNFGEGRIKIAAGISSNEDVRKYPLEKYLSAFKKIVKRDAALVIFGGPAELEAAEFLKKNLPKDTVKNFIEYKAGWRVDAAAMSLTDIYIGNFTGACDVAAALKKPVIALSRVAKDREKIFGNEPSEATIYYPWQTNAMVLQPEHQLEDCKTTPYHAGCHKKTAHCITQIKPNEIVDAFDKMKGLINKDVKFFDGDFEKFLSR